jgi:hypothetical protein
MTRVMSALLAALIGGGASSGAPTQARAETTYVYRTVHRVANVWRVRDVSHTNYVYRVHRVVHVTQVQPIIHVHLVTRVHEHTVPIVRRVNVWATQVLPVREIVTYSAVWVCD